MALLRTDDARDRRRAVRGERRLRRHGGQVPRAVRSSSSVRSTTQGLYDVEDGFFYDRLVGDDRPDDRGQGPDDRRDDPAAAGRQRPAAHRSSRPRGSASASRAPASAWPARTGAPSGASIYARSERSAARSRSSARSSCGCAPLVLRRGGVPLALRAPVGLEALPRKPVQRPGCARRDDRLRAGRVDDAMYGGNSNWRGPVWFPVNYLVDPRAAAVRTGVFGDEFTLEYPTGSGRQRTLLEIVAGPGRPARRRSGCRARRAPPGVRRRRAVPGPTRRGATTSSSSSTSTATTAPDSAPPTRPAGRRSSPISSSTRRSDPGRHDRRIDGSRAPAIGAVTVGCAAGHDREQPTRCRDEVVSRGGRRAPPGGDPGRAPVPPSADGPPRRARTTRRGRSRGRTGCVRSVAATPGRRCC